MFGNWKCWISGAGCVAKILFLLVLGTNSLFAQAAKSFSRIEEDWELVISTPKTSQGTPQIALEMRPDPASVFTGILTINFKDMTTFTQGGVQIQLWNNNTNVALSQNYTGSLNTPGETLTFTTYLDRGTNNTLKYGVKNGQSITWGNQGNTLWEVTTPDTTSGVLDSYDLQNSANNAQIVIGASRVKSLKLLRVRKYYEKGNKSDTITGVTVYP